MTSYDDTKVQLTINRMTEECYENVPDKSSTELYLVSQDPTSIAKIDLDAQSRTDAEISSIQSDLNVLQSDLNGLSTEVSTLSEWTTTQIDDLIGDVQEVSSQTTQNAQDIADISANLTHSTVRRWEYVEDDTVLTFTANQANSNVAMQKIGSAPEVSLEYTTDGGYTWNDFIVGETTVALPNIGDKIGLRAKTPNARTGTSRNDRNTFSITGQVVASGNIASILNKDVEQGKVLDSTLTYHLCGLFQDCTGLVGSAKGLIIPFETLYRDSLNSLFLNTRITIAPDLPCTSSEGSTYCLTFQNCTELVQAPALPITTLGTYAYAHMFQGCTSLTTAPELPSTTLAGSCYDNMFNGCTSLVNAPELPALAVPDQAYKQMFLGCTSLVNTPQIRATSTSGTNSLNEMFKGCSSLTTVSTLLPTTASSAAYAYMFMNCTSLTSMPVIMLEQANADNCCQGMFQGCTSLVNVELPRLQEAWGGKNCLRYMFRDCTSIVSASLPALTHAGNNNVAYTMTSMFEGCTSLKNVSIPALNRINNTYVFFHMFYQCSSLETVDLRSLSSIQSYRNMWYMFQNCTSLVEVNFSEATAVPNLSDVNAFANTNSTFQIVVPDALYDQWIVASNWSNFASQIVKASEYINN